MDSGISGGLLSLDYLWAAGRQPQDCDPRRARRYRAERLAARGLLGPAAAPQAIASHVVRPMLSWLGWSAVERARARGGEAGFTCVAAGAGPVQVLVIALDVPMVMATRAAARAALIEGQRWVFVTNGAILRIVHVLRTADRGFAEFDLDGCADNPRALAWLVHLAAPRAFRGDNETGIDHLVSESDAHGVTVCRALREGVADALALTTGAVHQAMKRPRPASLPASYGEALTAVYRVLFLLFAEARHLVPLWHPVYRDGYTLDALRGRLAEGRSARGTWAALQAMARLAHSGCDAGDLKVTAFNGRLFSPARAPLLDHLQLDDDAISRALASLVFTRAGGGLRRIAYAELGVEELGSVYESLLDLEPAPEAAHAAPRRTTPAAVVRLRATSTARKTTGTFYTPRAIADFIVSSTLEPLTMDRSADEILQLRVLDPAMGSGAFLVAALRYLTDQWERAIVAGGEAHAADIGPRDRARVRRTIASRCLFGVDRNPMAVQLAQLSVWLATLAADRPLSFLDHHLVAGDSLIGASPLDLRSRVPGPTRRRGPLPLEALFDWSDAAAATRPLRVRLELEPDDTARAVRDKEAVLATVERDGAVARWRDACDLWCACWMPGGVDPRLYHALLDRVLGRSHTTDLPQLDSLLRDIQRRAAQRACVHWPLAFPEVMLDEHGRPAADRGFDAVIGNPPWEMLRADERREHGARDDAGALVRFARDSGVYTAQGRGHMNQYQLFVERALMLARPAGRIGLLVPSGLLGDEGSAPLRRALIAGANVDALTVFDNRRALFPIHRSIRFVTLTATRGGRTRAIRCRFGVDDPTTLAGPGARVRDVMLTPAALERISGSGLEIPDLPSTEDLRIVESLAVRHPALSDPKGWDAMFGRELNATDDRDCMRRSTEKSDGLLVLEGKHVSPFRVDTAAATCRADRGAVRARLGARAQFDGPRLAYRDVASATNRLTLIAAIVPAGAVTVHTLFCLQTPLPLDAQRVLCVLLNSFVANYLVRRRVTTHVSRGIISRLPVPLVRPDNPLFDEMASAASALEQGAPADIETTAHGAAAAAYGVTADELRHVLSTFPIVPEVTRAAVLEAFIARTPPRSC